MQTVAKAKDKIKKFRRRPSSSCHERRSSVEDDLPPPYSENPPYNPFYNDLVHNVSQSNRHSDQELDRSGYTHGQHDLDMSNVSGRRSVGARHASCDRDRVSPMYPVLPTIAPAHPPPFSSVSSVPSAVTRRHQFGRRDSFQSDNEDQAADMMANMKLPTSTSKLL